MRRMSPDKPGPRNAWANASNSQVFNSPKEVRPGTKSSLRHVDMIAGTKVVTGALEDEEMVNQEYALDKIVKDMPPAVKMQTER